MSISLRDAHTSVNGPTLVYILVVLSGLSGPRKELEGERGGGSDISGSKRAGVDSIKMHCMHARNSQTK